MKNIGRYIAAAVLALLPMAADASLGGARISYLQGDVQIRTEDAGEWVPASVNTPLREGDSLWSPSGAKVEIQLRDGSVVRMADGTSLDVVVLEDDYKQFRSDMGSLYVKSGSAEDNTLALDLPQTSVKVSSPARLRMDVLDGGAERVAVFRGVVDTESRGARTEVKGGETLRVEGARTELGTALARPDDWEVWNSRRDSRLERKYASSRYLPSELESYSSDLDDNGEWVNDRDYGYVWRPRVVAYDWSPYSVGRWVWIGGDYVWISYESWGWAPYHYGRWIHTSYRGWCWVPPARGDVFWGPGYVGWVTTPSYVGWVPLAPGEIYYGRGHYGRHSHNITNINVTVINKVEYRNVRVKNGVRVVEKNSFSTGRPKVVKVRENIFRSREKVVIGRADVKPQRESYMPVVKKVAEEKLPPPKVRRRTSQEVKEIREQRKDEIRKVREERKSLKDERKALKEERKDQRRELREDQRGQKGERRDPREEQRVQPRIERKEQRDEPKARQAEERPKEERGAVREERKREDRPLRQEERPAQRREAVSPEERRAPAAERRIEERKAAEEQGVRRSESEEPRMRRDAPPAERQGEPAVRRRPQAQEGGEEVRKPQRRVKVKQEREPREQKVREQREVHGEKEERKSKKDD